MFSIISAQSSLQELLSSAGSLESLQLEMSKLLKILQSSYDYFTKNSYESTVKQLEYAESFSEEQFVKSELDSKRLELAVRLVKRIQGHVLIENYRDSISSTEIEPTTHLVSQYLVQTFLMDIHFHFKVFQT